MTTNKKRRAHWDASGHVRPTYAEQQHEHAAEPDPRGFLRDDTHDPVYQSLQSGEQFVADVTSSASGPQDAADQITSEELGGPFVESDIATELSPYKADEDEEAAEAPDSAVSKS
jgi:hypothetical protein